MLSGGQGEAALQQLGQTKLGQHLLQPLSRGALLLAGVFGDDEAKKETIRGLKSAEGFIRRMLAKTINLRNTPELTFVLDESIEYGVTMSKLIDEVTHKEDKKDEENEEN